MGAAHRLLDDPVDHLEAVALKPHDLAGRRITHQHHLADAEVEENLGADAIFN